MDSPRPRPHIANMRNELINRMLNNAWLLGGRELVEACDPVLDILLDDSVSDEECYRRIGLLETSHDDCNG